MLSAKKLRIVIIGTGPDGICMAIKLLEAGYDNFIVLEKAESLGDRAAQSLSGRCLRCSVSPLFIRLRN